MVVNRKKAKEVAKYHKVSIQIQELELQIEPYALPLEEIGIVLGAKCLMWLGSYTTNLDERFMEFNWQGQHYKLYGFEASTLKKTQIIHTNLTNTPNVREVKPINTDKLRLTTKTCPTKENLALYALREKHLLRGQQHYKHKYKYK